MSALTAKAFTKTGAYPSYISNLKRPPGRSDQIALHTAGCEFCAAEQTFLSASSQPPEEYGPGDMPAHLRRLAESLLIGKLKDSYKGSKYGRRSSLARKGLRI